MNKESYEYLKVAGKLNKDLYLGALICFNSSKKCNAAFTTN